MSYGLFTPRTITIMITLKTHSQKNSNYKSTFTQRITKTIKAQLQKKMITITMVIKVCSQKRVIIKTITKKVCSHKKLTKTMIAIMTTIKVHSHKQ